MDSFARRQVAKLEAEQMEVYQDEKAEALAAMFISAAGGDNVDSQRDGTDSYYSDSESDKPPSTAGKGSTFLPQI
jgi:hypothetical protein